jgi:hypothetical protein
MRLYSERQPALQKRTSELRQNTASRLLQGMVKNNQLTEVGLC